MTTWRVGGSGWRLISLAKKVHGSSRVLSTSEISQSSSESLGIYRLLRENERILVQEQRSLVERTRQLSRRVGIPAKLTDESGILDESVFTVVVAGEFNSGKSTLINALVGRRLLDVGHLPTTDCITILSYSDENDPSHAQQPTSLGVMHYSINLPLLQDMNLVDTPGTNALTNHTARTLNLLPKADSILFVTSADRPFPESERRVIEAIQQYRKNITIVVNKMDIIETSGGDHGYKEKQRIINFVADHASDLLGANPTVLALSARDALAAKLTSPLHEHEQAATWTRSNFGALESFLRDTLTVETKVKSKILNPIGLAEGWLLECQEKLAKESRELEVDRATLRLLSSQMNAWRRELEADMDRAREKVSSRLESESQRPAILLKRLHKVTNFFHATVLDPAHLLREWRKTEPISHKHETIRDELNEWIVDSADSIAVRGRTQGQAIIEFLGQRPSIRGKSLVTSVMNASKFHKNRDDLRRNMEVAIKRYVFDDYTELEDLRFLDSLQSLAKASIALFSSALAVAGAGCMLEFDPALCVGVGTTLTIAGISILIKGRSSICSNIEESWKARNYHLQDALKKILKEELVSIDQRVQSGVIPYTRLVEADEDRISGLTSECQGLLTELKQLRRRVDMIGT